MPIFPQASKELKDCNIVTSTYDAGILKWRINSKKNEKIRKCCIVNRQTTRLTKFKFEIHMNLVRQMIIVQLDT